MMMSEDGIKQEVEEVEVKPQAEECVDEGVIAVFDDGMKIKLDDSLNNDDDDDMATSSSSSRNSNNSFIKEEDLLDESIKEEELVDKSMICNSNVLLYENGGIVDDKAMINPSTNDVTVDAVTTQEASRGTSTLLEGEEDEEEEDQNEEQQQHQQIHAQQVQQEFPTPTAAAGALGNEQQQKQQQQQHILQCADISRDVSTAVSDRFRNAWIRVRLNPLTDTEAWKALLTEAQMGFKEAFANKIDFQKFDLLESIYGALLKYFPFSPFLSVGVMEFLYTISSYPEEMVLSQQQQQPLHHPQQQYQHYVLDTTGITASNTNSTTDSSRKDSNTELSRRRIVADLKLTHYIQNLLGVNNDNNEHTTSTNNNDTNISSYNKVRSDMLTSHASLWIIYLQKVSRDTHRKYNSIYTPEEARTAIIQAYENVLFGSSNTSTSSFILVGGHVLWKKYISYLTFVLTNNTEDNTNNNTKQSILLKLRHVYQRCIGIPMQDLDLFWNEYTNFEKQISELLSQPLLAEHLPRYQHAKQVYLERTSSYLQYAPELVLTSYDNSASFHATTTDSTTTTPHQQHLRLLSTPPENTEKEHKLLCHYLKRIAYERTNPERLSSADLLLRVRQAYKDTLCVFMRHVEVWHEWSSYELAHNSSSEVACEVLTFAVSLEIDSALLVASLSELLEISNQSEKAAAILDQFVTRSPCSLGFILYQRLIRRTQGVHAARNIFKRARQQLKYPSEDRILVPPGSTTTHTTNDKQPHPQVVVGPQPSTTTTATASSTLSLVGGDATMKTDWTMNRIKPKTSSTITTTNNTDNTNKDPKSVGYITWHLYASHAHMELRCNKCPQVAARVFELGLSRHRSFLTCPPYIQAYSRLLLEQGDNDNMRSLLERAIAACQQEQQQQQQQATATKVHNIRRQQQQQRLLWDMLLEFECNDALGDPKIIRNIEARRRRALPPTSEYDMESSELSKTLQEQLARVDGENAGLISGGLGRMVRRYELIGILGNGGGAGEYEDVVGGGESVINNDSSVMFYYGGRRSDVSFSYRYHGLSTSSQSEQPLSGAMGTANAGGAGLMDRSRAARERVQAAGGQSTSSTTATGKTSADAYYYPEWLRTLIAMLPTQRMQRMNSRPPPHMIEMALAALRTRSLPATRPVFDNSDVSGAAEHNRNGVAKRKRQVAGDDSSDDDGDARGGGGYSAQFRMRQRARQDASSTF